MIAYKPHTFLVGERVSVLDGIQVVYYENGADAVSILCQITPLAQSKAFTDFGVEGNNPHLLLADPEHYSTLKKGNIGICDGRTFSVNADPQLWNAEPLTSCVAVSLEELK